MGEMLSVSGEEESHVIGHMISHVSSHIISWGWYQKGVQLTFLKELMNIINRGQSRERDIGKKVDDFS